MITSADKIISILDPKLQSARYGCIWQKYYEHYSKCCKSNAVNAAMKEEASFSLFVATCTGTKILSGKIQYF